MASRWLDFVYLAGPVPHPGRSPVRFFAPFLDRLRPARWAEVEFEPEFPARPVRGTISHIRRDEHESVSRCEARTRAGRRNGARLIACGGPLAGRESLIRGLVRATGLPVLSGFPLAGAAMVEAAGQLLRWQGADPERSAALVLVDAERPILGEVLTDYLAERVGQVAVWGLERLKRSILAERVRQRTGAALEIPRSLGAGLETADLLVLAGDCPCPPLPGGRRLSVILDFAGTVCPLPGPGQERWLRLTSPQPSVGRGPGFTWPSLTPLRVRQVVFQAPPGWRGRAERGLEPGFVSAGLASAVTVASLLRPVPGSFRRQMTAEIMDRLRREALTLGFSPAAVAVRPLGPCGTQVS